MSSAEPKVEKEAGPPAEVATPPPEEEKKKREYKDFGHDEDKGPSRKFIHLQRLGTASSHHFSSRRARGHVPGSPSIPRRLTPHQTDVFALD